MSNNQITMKKSSTPILDNRLSELVAQKKAALKLKKYLRPNMKRLNDTINRVKLWQKEEEARILVGAVVYAIENVIEWIASIKKVREYVPKFATGGIVGGGNHFHTIADKTIAIHEPAISARLIYTIDTADRKSISSVVVVTEDDKVVAHENFDKSMRSVRRMLRTESDESGALSALAGAAVFENMIDELAKISPIHYIKSDTCVVINSEDKRYLDEYLRVENRSVFVNIVGSLKVTIGSVLALKRYQAVQLYSDIKFNM